MDYLTYPFHFPQSAALHDETQQQRQQVVDAQLEQLASSLDSTAGSLSGVLDDDASGHSAQRSISTLSSVSSIQLREHHIAAFSKLRTAAASGSKDAIPEEWKSYEPPSLVKGDWRSFGPTEAALTVIERNCGTEKHHVKHDRRKPSSLWRGTIWLTETHLIFVLDIDAVPQRTEQESHTENWVHSFKRMLSHSHKEAGMTDVSEEVLINDPNNGRPFTAFEIPLHSLRKASYKKASKHAAKRDSAASSSQDALSPIQSRTISPTLSRIQSRNARSSSHGRAREAKIPADHQIPAVNHDEQAEQPIDFGQLINRRDDPVIVRVYSEDDRRSVKVDIKFLSSLYEEEAKDLVLRLKEHLKRK